MAADKYDVKREFRQLYAPPTSFVEVRVPEFSFLMIDGHGDPNTDKEYADAVAGLYAVSYALKFAAKARGQDFVVAPLEGLWRADDPAAFIARDKEAWDWTMMINQPDWIDQHDLDAALTKSAVKVEQKVLDKLRIESFDEGLSVQILHRGSYDDEGPTLAALHDHYLPDHGYTFNGDHHEIYLSDARKTAPEKLRTILRQPVKKQ